ncbi:hypothetical protein EVAR_85066_1 [Eumeta japonica]|uniref:Uncharacterized protein n=1 Tax=Eumeta variegata TaxID=151549 RepID=A0A4C1XAJ5_EUMVA|nr:hypothetical protein EVAR_85066_1 [Eumeta japonica]
MAGNKANSKAKTKDDKTRMNKGPSTSNPNDDLEDYDLSLLRKPIHTSISSFAQARKIYDAATEELPHFESHTISTAHGFAMSIGLSVHETGVTKHVNEVSKIRQMEEDYQQSIKTTQIQEPLEENRIPFTKDLTTIIEEITKIKGVPEKHVKEKMHDVTLQTIPTSKVAVFQNINLEADDSCSDMRTEVKELQEIFAKDKAVLQPGGNFSTESSISTNTESSEIENVIQISDDDEVDESDKLKCKIWKSAAQIRRQRESIQAKAFRMNNPPAYYEKRKNNIKAAAALKVTEVEKFDRENQAWMSNMEGDCEVPRCGGCGRTFERRAALAAHTHTCQPRNRALSRRPLDSKKIEIQIRKDYNKGPTQPVQNNNGSLEASNTQVNTEEDENMETDNMDHDLLKTSLSNPNLTNDVLENKLNDLKTTDLSEMIVDDVKNVKASKKDQNANVTVETENRDTEIMTTTEKDHYLFDAVVEHNKTVHKLKGDREFYYTTVKALDSADAIDSNSVDEMNDNDLTNVDSRRPSRCSNDSSRSSDDSSSCNNRIEVITNKRKRKLPKSQNSYVNKMDFSVTPKKVETAQSPQMPLDKVIEIILGDPETPSKSISDQEHSKDDNSSDIEDPGEKSTKKLTNEELILTTRVSRPIRKRIKPKNEDFEYDLSNLLKLEAQGYRDQVSVSTRTVPVKRKSQNDSLNSDIVPLNTKDVSGVLLNMSRKAVEDSRAHLKLITTTSPIVVCNNINIRQRVTKSLHTYKTVIPTVNVSREESNFKTESIICKQEISEDKFDANISHLQTNAKSLIKKSDTIPETVVQPNDPLKDKLVEQSEIPETLRNNNEITVKANVMSNSGNTHPIITQKSLEVLKNPLVSQNITDFSKAGMTTKILVIKPVNRSKGKQDIINGPLKLKTIKIQDVDNKGKISTMDQVKFLKIAPADSNNLSKDKSDSDSDKSKQEVPRKQNIGSKNIDSDNNV